MCRHLGTPKEFAKRIHRSLRAWSVSEPKDVLSDLLLAQYIKAEQSTATPRLITNQILLDGLDRLKQINNEGAALLHRRFLDQETAQEIAYSLNVGIDVIFQRQRAAVGQLAEVLWQREQVLSEQRVRQIEARLEPRTYSQLFGIAEKVAGLRDQLETAAVPWLVAVEGLGGIGKTTLADVLVRELAAGNFFKDIGWVSAKQQEFLLATGLQPLDRPALDLDTFTHTLLDQLEPGAPDGLSSSAKLSRLTQLLKAAPYLVVVDNLETMSDHQTLLPTLRTLANPSKFILTSRHSLQAYPDLFCYPLNALSQADTLAFLKSEGAGRGVTTLMKASEAQLQHIYQIVGGNPLALKLVVGQLGIFSLPQVLDNLKEARGKKIDELYQYIYWQAWQALTGTGQQVLLAMPLAQNGDLAQLAALTQLDLGSLSDTLEQLITLSLVEVGGADLTERQYRIHRLTETFLLNEVARWQRVA